MDFLDLCNEFCDIQGTGILYSGGDYGPAEKSFLCLFPIESYYIKEMTAFHVRPGVSKPQRMKLIDPWEGLKNIIPREEPKFPDVPDWIGYLGYEMGAFSDLGKKIPAQQASIPDAFFMRHGIIMSLEHRTHHIQIYLRKSSLSILPEEQKRIIHILSSEEGVKKFLSVSKRKKKKIASPSLSLLWASEDAKSYKQKINLARELIFAGEIYQVNLSQMFRFKGEYSSFQVFRKIAAINPAAFMAYISFTDFTLVSSSPERFLCKRGDCLETRPIKGTMPRGETPEEDAANKEALLASSKEKAELLMITDLMRNDLGKVSQPGSVITKDIWRCEAYENVYHLVSVIHSIAKPDIHPIDILRKTFPGGSITGCPKLRAMEVIHELEGRPRGIYTGSIGYITENGNFDFNIAIRTLLARRDILEIQLGGAIVADSLAEKEYEETLHKGSSIFKTLGMNNILKLP
jgi:para-aminobenzoate synthetase component I